MGKYFKYAIGEIILVVIGILIALQINNWNEDKKSNKKELQLYKKMLSDLKDEQKILKEAYDDYREHNAIHQNLYHTIYNNDTYDSTLPYGKLRWNINFDPTFKDNYQDKMDQIHNDSINRAVLNYFRVQDQTQQVVNLFEKLKASEIRPFLTKNNVMNISKIFGLKEVELLDPKVSVNYPELRKHLKRPEFIHILTELQIKTEAGKRNIGYLKDANMKLQEIIKQNLHD